MLSKVLRDTLLLKVTLVLPAFPFLLYNCITPLAHCAPYKLAAAGRCTTSIRS